jgi:hypothetical protein
LFRLLLHHINFQIVAVELLVEDRVNLSMRIGGQRGALGDYGGQIDEVSLLVLLGIQRDLVLATAAQLTLVNLGQFKGAFDVATAEKSIKFLSLLLSQKNWQFCL